MARAIARELEKSKGEAKEEGRETRAEMKLRHIN
jgi:hypothetical protein